VGVADKLPGSQANCHHLAGSISEGRTSSRFPVVSTSFQDVRTRSMFIQTMKTPNPSSLMFVPGQTVMETGAADFTTMKEAMASPLARKLFAIEGVKGVFYGSDFITITKSDEVDWAELKPQAFAAIMDHFSSGAQLMVSTEHDDNAIHDDDDEVVAMIKELLETRIRPAVAEDGGDIAFKSFDPESGTVTLKMKVGSKRLPDGAPQASSVAVQPALPTPTPSSCSYLFSSFSSTLSPTSPPPRQKSACVVHVPASKDGGRQTCGGSADATHSSSRLCGCHVLGCMQRLPFLQRDSKERDREHADALHPRSETGH